MPKEDWGVNTVPKMFASWGAWPWTSGYPQSVLDVGCGLSLKSKFVETPIRVGLDIHQPYLAAIEADVPYVPICGDATKLRDLFLPDSFDLVLLLDIIEHVEKDESIAMLKAAEEIARVAVVVETPDGFFAQDLDILGFEQHHLQTHRCGWERDELETLGYQVFARDHRLYPVKRLKDSDEIAKECRLLNAIKRLDL